MTYGRATVVVTGTGMDTEMGKIAALMNQTQQRKTPLQQSLDQLQQEAGGHHPGHLCGGLWPVPVSGMSPSSTL